jgi:hypothetical protein
LTRAAAFVLAALLLPPSPGLAQRAPLSVSLHGGEARVVVGHVLDDAALEDALQSGLPLRMRFRLELWRDRLFDELADHVEWSLIVAFEPLEGRFLVARHGTEAPDVHGSYASVRAVVERSFAPGLRPRSPGRYYYLAGLEIESLTLSDLEELRHWLRGELGPAMEGRRSVAAAIGTGVRRAFIRILRLPTRHYQARSEAFEFP